LVYIIIALEKAKLFGRYCSSSKDRRSSRSPTGHCSNRPERRQ